jgi:pimeloyl-ACP methyl ester carboxylesterase
MPTTTNHGVRLYWESQGSGEPILLITGHRFRRHMWYPVIPALAEHYRVITMDNRGMGDSSTPCRSWTISDMADDALAVLDAAGVTRAHIHGMSMGGFIALDIAIRAPERVATLTIGCSGARLEVSKPDIQIRLRHLLTRKGRKELVTTMLHGPAASEDDVAVSLRAVAKNKPGYWGSRGQRRAMLSQRRTVDDLRRVDAPTLILHGDADRLMPLEGARRLADNIPGAKLTVLPGAGHYYMADAKNDANAALLAFLRSHTEM